MASFDNLHSRIVAWLKVILPLSALALLSTVFLVARQSGPTGNLPFSKGDLEEMASEQTVSDPVFSSLTEKGERFVLTANSATPRDGDYNVVDAVRVHGTLEEDDGDVIDIRSEEGTFFSKQARTVLRGNVRISTSSGYRLETEELTSSTSRTEMESSGPVHGEGPLGQIDAGRLFITSEERPDGTEEKVTVVFKDGVKVIYTPQSN